MKHNPMKTTLLVLSVMFSLLAYSCQPSSHKGARLEEPQHDTVWIKGSVGMLKGDVWRPVLAAGDVQRVPVAIFAHGLNSSRNRHFLSRRLPMSIVKYNMGYVAFDFNGHGESEGAFIDHTILNETDDLDSILCYVRKLEWVDTTRISVIGHSQGGIIAGLLAARKGSDPAKGGIHSIVLLASGGDLIKESLAEGKFLGIKFTLDQLGDSIPLAPGRSLGREYIKAALETDVIATTAKYDGPVCLIHGDNDPTVPVSMSRRYKEAIPSAELLVFDALTHSFHNDVASAILATTEYLIRDLKPQRPKGRIYVSSSKGCDSNPGTMTKPVASIARALSLGNDIRLRRGDWFYESIEEYDISVSSYGPRSKGKPVLSGFRKLAAGQKGEDGQSIWQRGSFDGNGIWAPDETGDIYRLDMKAPGIFSGFTDNSKENCYNIGTLYDPSCDRMYGRKCQSPSEAIFCAQETRTGSSYKFLTKDYDYFQVTRPDTSGIQAYRYLFVKASSPSLLRDKELWMSVGVNAIRGASKTVKGIKVFGWGYHGVKGFSDVHIEDCDFDIIGGSVLVTYPRWVRYGNGVEFWATSSRNSSCRGCRFSRVYDTATTIQGPMSQEDCSYCENIIFENNTMTECRQDFEVWIRTSDNTMPENCAFIGNKGYDSGSNGFESEEVNNTHLLHYVSTKYTISGIKIEDNEFWGGQGLYYVSGRTDAMPIGRTIYHCELGAPLLKNGKGFVITAPVYEDGAYRYASSVSEDRTVIYSTSSSLDEAVEGTQKTLGDLTGDYDFKILISPRQ